jgi:hypothetical protein
LSAICVVPQPFCDRQVLLLSLAINPDTLPLDAALAPEW